MLVYMNKGQSKDSSYIKRTKGHQPTNSITVYPHNQSSPKSISWSYRKPRQKSKVLSNLLKMVSHGYRIGSPHPSAEV